ncbi:MAG TPA: acyl carrier protein [Geobacteraceae bacterium]
MIEMLKKYMEETFMFEFNDEITLESDLFKMGIIDSYGYIKLLKNLESEFGIEFTEDEILDNVFVSVSSIVDCVSRKLVV